MGNIQEDNMAISRIFLDYFANILTSNNNDDLKAIHRVVENRVTQEMKDVNQNFTAEEVRYSLMQMKGTGPDGLSTLFYHH